jgi:PPM family protein phosphatase
MVELRWGAMTSSGMVRTENEDTYVTEPMVFAVADGMGGHQAGEVASALAASIVRDRLGRGASSEDDAESVVHEVNDAIYGAARANAAQSGMGTTLTALTVLKPQGQGASMIDEQFVLLNVGDSRTYLYRNAKLSRVTVDHSYVQELVATGHITMEEARTHPRRNIVTRALGIEPNVRADMWTMPIVRGDRFVLCSDGLVDEVADSEIIELVASVADPQALSEQLVDLANKRGGRDNVTVVVVDVLDGADPPDPTEEFTVDPSWAENATDAAIWHDDTTGAPGEPNETLIAGTNAPASGPTIAVPSTAGEVPRDATQASSIPTVPPPAFPLGSPPDFASPPAGPTVGAADAGVPTEPPPSLAANLAGGVASGPATAIMPTLPPADSRAATPVETDDEPATGRKAKKASKAGRVKAPRRRRLTGGLFLFVVVLAAIIITTFTLVAVHARSGYFVGFNGDKVVIYKGQPGGVLWFNPTVERDSALTRTDLAPAVVELINEHVIYDSVEEAAEFITVQVTPAPTTTTTTVPETTSTTVAATTTLPGETTTTFPSGP